MVYDTVGPALVSDAFDLSHLELASGLGCASAAADTDAVFGGAALAGAPCGGASQDLGGGAWPTQDSRGYSTDDGSGAASATDTDRFGGLLNILHEDILRAYYSAPAAADPDADAALPHSMTLPSPGLSTSLGSPMIARPYRNRT